MCWLVLTGVGILIAFIMSKALISALCGSSDDYTQYTCEDGLNAWLYIVLGSMIVMLIPFQVLCVRIFKAYADDMKTDDSFGKINN